MRDNTKPVPVHYLKENARDWSPPHVVFFDTETEPIPDTEPEVNKLILWVASSILRRDHQGYKARQSKGNGFTGQELVEWLEGSLKGIKTTWIYAHNLAFDLTSTNLLNRLFRAGWELTDSFSTDDTSPFFRLTKANKRLIFVDSYSWLPEALERIGKAIHIKKPPLPPADNISALFKRCEADVKILQTAILDLMDWWDSEHLGNWAITGASCGWSTFRHKIKPRTILIDPDREGLEHDKLAIFGGRRDTWRIGTFKVGPYLELDFKDAHPTLALHLPMPRQRHRLREGRLIKPQYFNHSELGFIASVVVHTDQPRYPLHWDNHVWFPVGTFRTTLAGPELAMAHERGELLDVIDGRAHMLGNQMSTWAEWCLGISGGDVRDIPPVARIAAKAWGRSVIGKFASRTSTMTGKRPSEYGGYHLVNGWDEPNMAKAVWVMINGTEYAFIKDQWGQNAYPAVWAWIESCLRVRMATVIDSLPQGSIITCNTDGLIVDAKRLDNPSWRKENNIHQRKTHTNAIAQWCEQISAKTWPLVLRVKASHNEINVFGPAQMQVDDKLRWSGIAKGAERTGPMEFTVRDWPTIGYQLAHNAQAGYLRPLRVIRPKGPFAPRWACSDGQLRPPEATTCPANGSRLLPYRDPLETAFPGLTAGYQHPALARLL